MFLRDGKTSRVVVFLLALDFGSDLRNYRSVIIPVKVTGNLNLRSKSILQIS